MAQPTPGPSGPRAGFWIRFGGLLLDGLVVGIPLNIVLFAVDSFVLRQAVSIAVGVAYAVYFIGSPSGQTVGMKVCSIRVIDTQTGGPIDYGRALIRYVMAFVSGAACLIGYLWMLWDPEKQTWQDKVANTYVVPTTAFPVDKWPG
jgi:uncharacterized RDD family membrane protein YckC